MGLPPLGHPKQSHQGGRCGAEKKQSGGLGNGRGVADVEERVSVYREDAIEVNYRGEKFGF
jgi:hypothetical protein